MTTITDCSVDVDTPSTPAPMGREEAIQRTFEAVRANTDQRLWGNLERGTALVRMDLVREEDDGSWTVGSQDHPDLKYEVRDLRCNCPTADKFPDGWDKHVFAAYLLPKVTALLRDGLDPTPPALAETDTPVRPMPQTAAVTKPATRPRQTPIPRPQQVTDKAQRLMDAGIHADHIRMIHGKEFVHYVGLLKLAHERGLVSLVEKIEFHNADVVYASATATFQDDRVFTGWSDATPENVQTDVRAHFPRIALTRAKARALRDALNIAACSVEEREVEAE